MNIKVTTTKVEIDNESLNKGEYNIRECNFDLAEEFTGLVCKALFTISKTKLTYEQSIVNGKCNIPYEATLNRGKVIIGVIGYEIEDEELIKRYSPEPDEFFVLDGSYVEDIENQSIPTPSELEQLEQRVSAIEIDAGQVEINTQDISNIKQEQITQNNDILLRPLITETGSQIELTLNSTNFKMTATLKDKNGTVVNTSNEIDLPLESVVVNASYDSSTKELVLTLQNGTTVRFSVADLVSGLVSDTDYATSSKGGVIKVNDYYKATSVTDSGALQAETKTYAQYNTMDNSAFIGKGTLENVIVGKQLINQTQLNTKEDKSALVTGTGSNITLQNTAELEFIQPPLPRGNSEQDGEPSPTNEVPIQNVTGDVEVLVQNKNLFDKDNVTTGYTYSSTGTLAELPSSFVDERYIPVTSSTEYSLSTQTNYSSTVDYRLVICEYDKYKNFIKRNIAFESGVTKSTITTTSSTKYVRLCASTVTLDELQFEIGNVRTTYTPHQEQTFTFPLGNQRMYLGDYLADDGIHHVRKQIELTGNENWITHTAKTWGSICYLNLIGILKDSVVLSNQFVYYRNLGDLQTDVAINKISSSIYGNNYLYLGSSLSNNTALKSWLAEQYANNNSIIVEYELATEEITPYTEPQQAVYDEIKQAMSYEEQTNISGTSDEANPLFEVQAVQYKEPDYWTIAYVNGQIGNAIGGAY